MISDAITTLHPIVWAIGRIDFEGNTIPHVWYQTLKLPSGKPDLPAIVILSEIIYWYRPTRELEEGTGKRLEPRKKFSGDIFQAGAAYFENKLGLTKDQVRKALKRLEDLGCIRREYRNLIRQGRIFNNIMYIEPIPARILDITHPPVEGSPTRTGGTTPLSPGSDTLSPAPGPLSPGGDTPSLQGDTLSPGGDTPSLQGDTLSPGGDTPSPRGETYTKTSTEISTETSTETTTTTPPAPDMVPKTRAPSSPQPDGSGSGSGCGCDADKGCQKPALPLDVPTPAAESNQAPVVKPLLIPEILSSSEGQAAVRLLVSASVEVQSQAQDLLWELGGQVASKRRMGQQINPTLYLHGLIRAAATGKFELAAGIPLRKAHEHILRLNEATRRNEAAALAELERAARTTADSPDRSPSPQAPAGQTTRPATPPPPRSGRWSQQIQGLRAALLGRSAPLGLHDRPAMERPRC